MDQGRGGKGRNPSSSIRRLSKDGLQEHLEETRLIDELDWVRLTEALENTVRHARLKVGAACNHSTLCYKHMKVKGSAVKGVENRPGKRRKQI